MEKRDVDADALIEEARELTGYGKSPELNCIRRLIAALEAERQPVLVSAEAHPMVADHPDLDATDGAHPAWWRGQEAGAKGLEMRLKKMRVATFRDAMKKILDCRCVSEACNVLSDLADAEEAK